MCFVTHFREQLGLPSQAPPPHFDDVNCRHTASSALQKITATRPPSTEQGYLHMMLI